VDQSGQITSQVEKWWRACLYQRKFAEAEQLFEKAQSLVASLPTANLSDEVNIPAGLSRVKHERHELVEAEAISVRLRKL
jgi:hypothetical protein